MTRELLRQDGAAAARSVPLRAAVASAALLAVTLMVIVGRLGNVATAQSIAESGLLLYVIIEAPRLKRGAWLMAAAAATAAMLAAFTDDPQKILGEAADRAAFFAALLTGLAFVREAALTSPLLLRVGPSLLAQTPGARYLIVTVGSHLASVVLNFGVMPLLGTAIQRQASHTPHSGKPDRPSSAQRRMNLALLRGFAAMTMWSPLSLSFAVTVASVRSLDPAHLVPAGLMTAALFICLGWLCDHLTGATDRPARREMTPGQSRWPLLALLLLVAEIVFIVATLAFLLACPLLDAVIVAAPLIGCLWLVIQSRRDRLPFAIVSTARRLCSRIPTMLPTSRDEIVILGGASFIGSVIAALVPTGAVQATLLPLSLPPSALAVLFAWTIILAGQAGLGPLIIVTVLGAAVPDPAVYGLHPVLLGVAFMAGWGLAVGSTPVAAGILILARMVGVRAKTIGRDWNGRYTVLGAFLLAAWLVILDLALRFA